MKNGIKQSYILAINKIEIILKVMKLNINNH